MTSQAARDLAPAGIPAGTWSIVPDASTASFTVKDKLFFTVHGTIPVSSGICRPRRRRRGRPSLGAARRHWHRDRQHPP